MRVRIDRSTAHCIQFFVLDSVSEVEREKKKTKKSKKKLTDSRLRVPQTHTNAHHDTRLDRSDDLLQGSLRRVCLGRIIPSPHGLLSQRFFHLPPVGNAIFVDKNVLVSVDAFSVTNVLILVDTCFIGNVWGSEGSTILYVHHRVGFVLHEERLPQENECSAGLGCWSGR